MSAIPASKAFTKLELLKLMLLSREGDRREGILLRQGKGWFHIGAVGHEALGAMAYTLREDDYVFPYYRDRTLMLARGFTNYELALAFYAKQTSDSAGRQMPGHFNRRDKNVFSVCTPTGGELLPACGAAWAMKLAGADTVCLSSVGDAATRQGEFYEAVSFAVQEKLPIVFVVEDNKYGISTPTAKMLPFRMGIYNPELIQPIEGRNPETVFSATQAAVNKARSGEGPSVLWMDIDRLASHTSSDDHRIYRTAEDIAAMEERDPIKLLAEALMQEGVLDLESFVALQDSIRQQVDEEYQRAEKEAEPSSQTTDHLFGNDDKLEKPPVPSGRTTMVAAINSTLKKALEEDHKVVLFGEDIEDPKGGVFGMSKGLSEAFPKQVFNSPLAEATIMGVAVGMAAYGWKPVFELQFIDFMAPGWNQITSNMATLRWRTSGDWKCPCVIYAPYGAYLPGGGIWHSQSNEGYFAHTPGLRVAIPSTPEDAAGLFWTAIHGEDPTFILVPKHIFRKPVDVENAEPVPFGKARIVQEGSDVTVVTYGNTIELAVEAAGKTTASLEIIDLRSIVPLDYETITRSVEKTGRLIVIHEDNHTGGVGQAILAEMTRVPERWNLFLSPPQLIARDDVPVGFNPVIEYASLPDLGQILQAIQTVME